MSYKKYTTKLGIVKSHEDAKLPQQSVDDVGYDVFSVENVEIPNMTVGKIDIGIKFASNPHYPRDLTFIGSSGNYAYDDRWSLETKIEGRSGLASKGLFPVGGIVDPAYRGPIIVCLLNLTGETYKIKKGDKIAQLVIRPVLANTENHHIEFVFRNKQEETDRGSKGFGSSGK